MANLKLPEPVLLDAVIQLFNQVELRERRLCSRSKDSKTIYVSCHGEIF